MNIQRLLIAAYYKGTSPSEKEAAEMSSASPNVADLIIAALLLGLLLHEYPSFNASRWNTKVQSFVLPNWSFCLVHAWTLKAMLKLHIVP
jgi:hypothetical protein